LKAIKVVSTENIAERESRQKRGHLAVFSTVGGKIWSYATG